MALATMAFLAVITVQAYPPPFPREDVSKVFENERVVVWQAHWTSGRPSAMHQHVLDLVGVVLVGGRTRVILPDGSTRESRLSKTGDVMFQPKGVIHIEEPLVDGARTIGIELKEVSAPVLVERPNFPRLFPAEGANLLFDNSRVAIWDYRWTAERPLTLHFHDRDLVVVPIENGLVRVASPDGQAYTERQQFGEVFFKARGQSDREEAVEGSPRAILVELK